MYVVISSREKMPTRCWGRYRTVAVVKCQANRLPKQINSHHRSVLKVVKQWNKLFEGTSERCAFARALRTAQSLCDKLNDNERQESESLSNAGY